MRVIQVTPRYPPRTGGVETHVKELSERLVKRGHEVVVLTADDSGDVQTQESRNGVKVIRHRGLAPDGAFHFAPGILSTLSGMEADIVHAHNYHSLPLLFAAVAGRDARFVATPHYHGGSASSFRDRLLSIYCPLGGWALRNAEGIIAVSDWERDQLAEDFGISATVVPNGIELKRFRDAEPHEHERPYLLTVGRLKEYKGVQHLIRALSEIHSYDLLVAGSGEYADTLREVAYDAGLADRVEFLGYVPDAELPGLYAGATAFVTLSEFEAYGMTVGEALAAGTPCVVRERGALVDWTHRPDCIGVADTTSRTVANAVKLAVEQTPDPSSLPTWEDTVNGVLAAYEMDQT